ncbi:uncharacterized protein troap, partial [Symphorus nematophorus]
MGRKAPVRPGVSRLPVLAKSLHLQTPSDFSQSHCTWEEKPLAGKAKKKKACTRPVPFNLSQPKSSRTATENQQPLTVSQSRTSTCAIQPNNNPQRVSVMKSRQKAAPPTGSVKSVQFSPDSAALQSILQNEGVKVGGPVGAVHRNSVCPSGRGTSIYSVQRVPVRKICEEETRGPGGSVKSVQFSPDSAALQSILQNEGVKVGGPMGAAHRNSVCPSGRGTSIYSAQRVPVKKNRVEATGGPGAGALKENPLSKCTPQRVRNTRHQPMSAMKWHQLTQKTPYTGTPGHQSCKTSAQQHQEEVVQKLFDDQEDEQNTNVQDKDPATEAEQIPVQDTTIKSSCEEKVEKSRASSNEDEDQRTVLGQPFIQAPQRESVIFFSTGKKLLRAPRFEQQEKSADHKQHGLVSSGQTKVERLPVHEETSSVLEPTCQINPSVQSLHRDLIVQKTCALGPAVAMLRKRLPPLEELRMDEEVATYT